MINRLSPMFRGARGRAVCILTALLSLSGARDASAVGWQPIPGAPSAGRLDDMHFLDPLTGWVCTSSGEIWRTTTGGASWDLQLATPYYMRTIYFADAQTGFAGTLGSQLLFRTTDGGAKWNAVPNSVFPALPPAICGMSGVGDHVYGTGAYFAPAMLVRSTDRGVTWDSTDMSPYARNLIDCHFVTPTSGFAVGGARARQARPGRSSFTPMTVAPPGRLVTWEPPPGATAGRSSSSIHNSGSSRSTRSTARASSRPPTEGFPGTRSRFRETTRSKGSDSRPRTSDGLTVGRTAIRPPTEAPPGSRI